MGFSNPCKGCKYEDDRLADEPCRSCESRSNFTASPMTNADRIRAMSDEELTEFLEKVELGEFWADVPWVDWLKQEVE